MTDTKEDQEFILNKIPGRLPDGYLILPCQEVIKQSTLLEGHCGIVLMQIVHYMMEML